MSNSTQPTGISVTRKIDLMRKRQVVSSPHGLKVRKDGMRVGMGIILQKHPKKTSKAISPFKSQSFLDNCTEEHTRWYPFHDIYKGAEQWMKVRLDRIYTWKITKDLKWFDWFNLEDGCLTWYIEKVTKDHKLRSLHFFLNKSVFIAVKISCDWTVQYRLLEIIMFTCIFLLLRPENFWKGLWKYHGRWYG